METVDRMDLTNMIIEVQVRNAYSKGGIPLAVQGVANIKVPGEEPLIHASLDAGGPVDYVDPAAPRPAL